MSQQNIARFREVYEAALRHEVAAHPEDYMYSVDDVPRVVDKMVPAYAAGTASVGRAMQRAAKTLGLKPTLSAVRAWLNEP